MLYELSYVNLIMLGAVLPSYGSRKAKAGRHDDGDVIRADDPRNRERVRAFFDSIK